MAETSDNPLAGRKLQGLKYLDKILPLFDRLHDVGCPRDWSGNRKLHFDHSCALILRFLLNPVLRSFRALQPASLLEQVRRKVGCARTSLRSLSEAVEVFEPQRHEAIIAELWAEVPPSRGVGKEYVRQVPTAVDGSVVKTLASLAEAAYLRDTNGNTHCGWRFHTPFEIDRPLPVRIEVTAALNGGKTDEKHVLRKALQPDPCYVMDRWYAEFAWWNDIVAAGSSYVGRIRDNSNLDEVSEQRPVSEAARRAGVLRDIVVKPETSHQADARPNHPVRVILVKAEPHQKTGGRKGGTAGFPSDGILRIATNLLDVPAEIVVLAEYDAASVLDRDDKLGVFVRSEASQDSHAECRAQPTRCVAVLDPQRDAKEGGGGTGGARLVRIPGRSQHSGFIDRNEGVQIRIPASAVQERR